MEKIKIYQIDAFTNKPFEGNSAAVTFGDDLSKKQMQSIAREMNLAETAFLSNSDKADYKLKWFTPTTEVELCGHATIASLHFLNENNLIKNNSISFETLSGIINCKYVNGFYFMQIPIFSMKEFKGNLNEILTVLGISEDEIDKNVPPTLVENTNLYLYIKNISSLKNIKPDFKALKKLIETKKEFGGLVAFTLETFDKDNFAHSRYFAPAHGIDEDIVTGSTNGPLLLVLKKLRFIRDLKKEITLTFEQGDFLNRPGRVKVIHNPNKNELYIAGKAVTVMKGELIF